MCYKQKCKVVSLNLAHPVYKGTRAPFKQCCWQGLETQGRGQGRTRSQAARTRTWKLVLEDNTTAVRQYGQIDMNFNLTGAQWQISHPFITRSLQDDGAWYFACHVSLLNPRKFSRTWTSEDEDKDEDLKIGPRGSSRTRTFIEDNNTGLST